MLTSITANEIENKVLRAINRLKQDDFYLLENNLNECSINHKLAWHLQIEFPEWHVDCEYNKQWEKIKELDLPKDKIDWTDTESKTVYPDIIVHRRGGNGPNLLAIEVKKSSNKSDRKHDYNKLEQYGETLSYSCTLFLEIGTGEKTGNFDPQWIRKENFVG